MSDNKDNKKQGFFSKLFGGSSSPNENNIQANIQGDESKVAFNSRFLLDVLGVFDSKDIILETNTPSSPGVFKSLDHPGYTHVIMPMFVQW